MRNRIRLANMRRLGQVARLSAIAWLAFSFWQAEAETAATQIDFNRDVRPILSENCFKCHGPDQDARKARLRLDVREGATASAESGAVAIVPGAPERSEMLARVLNAEVDRRMPPAKAGKPLSPAQVQTLRLWIDEGAHYSKHWSYIKPVRPVVPETTQPEWTTNAIDRFILEKLEKQGLGPSPRASPEVLVRRVYLDLTGLPPSPKEVEAFVRDPNASAYENLVDHLLNQPAFGEHWARWWLDLSRYADSAGYADDPPRKIWAFRDYVIRAFNSGKPFDRFTIEQIAGDLLEDPTEEDRVATSFHRNTMTNNEGGTDDEEFRNAAVVDRVNTTMSVWMGTSMACAQCHTHKYDPLSQKEYFQMFAIFNNTADTDKLDETPVLKFFTGEQKKERRRIQKELAAMKTSLQAPRNGLTASQKLWERDYQWHRLASALGGATRSPYEAAQYDASPDQIRRILELAPRNRDVDQKKQVAEFYQAELAPELASERRRAADLALRLEKIQPNTVPIMRELDPGKQRETRVHIRGNFQQHGEVVHHGIPEVFHALPDSEAPPRLALARWLVDADNPLTSRVLANRLWEQIFGIGLVRTSEEFGAQGDLPTHAELLDWLATELVARGWDIKAFLKLLVTSATYSQSSRATPELIERDPENIWLSRGPRFRMTAEVIRDQALAVSGLLSRKMFGPSVRPPQPSLGLSAAFGGSLDWKESKGEDRYRRAVYIEWRRTNPYASLSTFDAPNREVCTLKRPRSNSPLQALVTLNDPVYVEAAQALARRIALAPGSNGDKVRFGFKLCLARAPRETELNRVESFFESSRKKFATQPEQALKLATDPLGPAPEGTEVAALAAWTAVANVLLNLDETLMRP